MRRPLRPNGALFLNDAGQAAGLASRYNGSTDSGGSAWFYSGGNTQEIGLTGAAYTRDDGYQANTVEFLNILGQAAGYAERFNGAAYAGQSAWFYDPLTNQTYSMDAAVPVPMTYSDSYIMYLGNDGLALGYYSRFDAGGTDLGNGAFSFSVADGWNDLGSLVNGGLDAAGWQQLGEAYRANSAGQIIGNGFLAGMNGGAVFLLAPVPEPETWSMLLAGLGLVGAAVRRRRGIWKLTWRGLHQPFNPCAVDGLMCRTLLSVSWDGYLYDCDFNLSRDLPLGGRKVHVSQIKGRPQPGSPIAVAEHCYTCTAGSGFT